VHAQAGVATSRLLAAALGWQLAGVEFLAGVPGTVGGGLVMNAGTVLGSFADLVCEVRSLSAAGEPVVRERDACGFVYRGSLLGRGEVVVGARLRLCSGGAAESLTAVRRLFKQRRQREPRGLPSAGSIFKNPDGDFAGRLLEAAGCKGARVGEAEISSVHANWIVNLGAARASDVLALIARARRQVAERCGVDLRLELRCLGDFGGPAELEGALDCCGGFDDAGHGAATGQPGAANQRAAADQRATTGQPAAADQGAAVGQRAAKEAR
jgi:UDP-N-acetylmuramate dehydrogenase